MDQDHHHVHRIDDVTTPSWATCCQGRFALLANNIFLRFLVDCNFGIGLDFVTLGVDVRKVLLRPMCNCSS